MKKNNTSKFIIKKIVANSPKITNQVYDPEDEQSYQKTAKLKKFKKIVQKQSKLSEKQVKIQKQKDSPTKKDLQDNDEQKPKQKLIHKFLQKIKKKVQQKQTNTVIKKEAQRKIHQKVKDQGRIQNVEKQKNLIKWQQEQESFFPCKEQEKDSDEYDEQQQQQYSDFQEDQQYGQKAQSQQSDQHESHKQQKQQKGQSQNRIIKQKKIKKHRQSRIALKKNKNRKIRTTITVQKLSDMNQIFNQYARDRQSNRSAKISLKKIGLKLGLGYSTILHKYRQFRHCKKVSGGALIQSLKKKRKYKKSVDIQKYINQALKQDRFYTAVQLSKYIYDKFGKKYSRSIISRHLGQMGYSYKNIKKPQYEHSPQQKKQIKMQQIQKKKQEHLKHEILYSQTMLKLIRLSAKIMHLQQIHFKIDETNNKIILLHTQEQEERERDQLRNKKQKPQKRNKRKLYDFRKDKKLWTLFIIAEKNKILFWKLHHGVYEKAVCFDLLKQFLNYFQTKNQEKQQYEKYFMNQIDLDSLFHNQQQISKNVSNLTYLVMSFSKVHRDRLNDQLSIKMLLLDSLFITFYTPVKSPQFNSLQQWCNSVLKIRLSQFQFTSTKQLQTNITTYMEEIRSNNLQKYFVEVQTLMKKVCEFNQKDNQNQNILKDHLQLIGSKQKDKLQIVSSQSKSMQSKSMQSKILQKDDSKLALLKIGRSEQPDPDNFLQGYGELYEDHEQYQKQRKHNRQPQRSYQQMHLHLQQPQQLIQHDSINHDQHQNQHDNQHQHLSNQNSISFLFDK